MKNKVSLTINKRMLREIDSMINNLSVRNRSQAIEYLIDSALKDEKVAVVLAGDSKAHKDKQKESYAMKIDGKTIIERIIKKLSDSGFKTIYIIGDHKTLTRMFEILGNGTDRGLKLEYVDEESQEGTAGALKLLKGKVTKPFLTVCNDVLLDNLNLAELWKQHNSDNVLVTMLITSSTTRPIKGKPYFIKMEGNKITDLILEPSKKEAASGLFFTGVCVIDPEMLTYPGKRFGKDIVTELIKKRLAGGMITAVEHLHVHDKEDLAKVKKKLNY